MIPFYLLNGKETPEYSRVRLIRKISRTYTKNMKLSMSHFLSNRNRKKQAFCPALLIKSSMQTYPSSTVTNFTTQLPNTFFLNGH